MDQKEGVVKLIELQSEKASLLEDMINLSKHQVDFLNNKEIDKLQRLLESKQIRIDKINSIDQDFLQKFNEIKEKYYVDDFSELSISKEYLSELKNKTGFITELLDSLAEWDKMIQNLSTKVYKEMKVNNNKIQKASKARKGYNKQMKRSDGIYLDKKN